MLFEPFEFFVAVGVACALGFFLGNRRPFHLNMEPPEPIQEDEEISISVEMPRAQVLSPPPSPVEAGFDSIDFADEGEQSLPGLDEPIKGIEPEPSPTPTPPISASAEETHIEALRMEIEALEAKRQRELDANAQLSAQRREWETERLALSEEIARLNAEHDQDMELCRIEIERVEARANRISEEVEEILALEPFGLAQVIELYEARRHDLSVELKTSQQILMEAPIVMPTGEADAEALAHAAVEQKRQDDLQAEIQDHARALRKVEAIISDLKARLS